MQFRVCVCVLLAGLLLVSSVDSKKSYSSRRKGGSNRRGSSTSSQPKPPPPQPATTHHKTDSNTDFLNSERGGSSHGSGSVNTHHRQTPFNNKPAEPPGHVPQTNGPIGFEKLNSEVQRKPASPNVPSAPAYPGGSPPYPGGGASYPGKPASAPNGPPPAYPGYQSSGTNFDPPPAYPGRPVNAPPVYSASNPNFGQRNPAQPGFGGYPNQQGGFSPQGSYPGQSYPGQQNFGNSGGNFGQNYQGQHGFGYPNTMNNVGNYPNQGFGSHSSSPFGNGHQNMGFGGSPFGGSSFGQSHYGGAPFGSSGYGGNSFGGYGNSHYTPNNFGFSNNPGLFGSNSGYQGNHGGMFGQHKRSRFGGLPIPIPIPIPIPLGGFGGFGGFGGRSHNHNVLDSFVKNKTINSSDNATTSVFILNNSTVTPCTTDQFIYDSLNVTVMSCTAGNCTAVKVFVTSNVSSVSSVRSAGLTMCLESNTTYSSFADNVNPTVSDLHKYWMNVCRELVTANTTSNVTDQVAPTVLVKVSEAIINETVVDSNSTESVVQSSIVQENSTALPNISATFSAPSNNSAAVSALPNNGTTTLFETTTTITNSSVPSNSSTCEIFDCSWLEMCLPSVEILDNCSSTTCPQAKTTFRPCVRIKMCKSPTTPLSTFATLNNTISHYDQFNNVTTFHDVANLTLISYMPPTVPTNCSQNATDPSCQFPSLSLPLDNCAQGNYSQAATDGANSTTLCLPPASSEAIGTEINSTMATL